MRKATTKVIDFNLLSGGTGDEPNEVGLTFYFNKVGDKNMADFLMKKLLPDVEAWTLVADYTVIDNGVPLQEAFIAKKVPTNVSDLYLLRVLPPLTKDTEALQLIVNLAHGAIENRWKEVTQWLREIAFSALIGELKDNYLGYTITYRANLTETISSNFTVHPEVLRALGLIHTEKSVQNSKPIAFQQVDDKGWLLLVDYPESPAGGLVYLLIGAKNQGRGLAEACYAGIYSELISIDSFVHKGLLEGMELLQVYEQANASHLGPLRQSVDFVLGQLRQNEIDRKHLQTVVQMIDSQGELYWYLERSEQSLLQQIRGIKRLFADKKKSIIAEQHLIRLEAYAEEVNAIIAKNKLILDTGRFAVVSAQGRSTIAANRIQESFNRAIAVIGIFLAATQVFDSEFAKQILKFIFPIGEKDVYTYWAIFTTRNLSAVVITTIFYGLFLLIRPRKLPVGG